MDRVVIRTSLLALTVLFSACLTSLTAHAGAGYLSATGTGTFPNCTAATPCSDFNAALNTAGDGGMVICLTPGFFSSDNTVEKGFTLNCPNGTFGLLDILAPGKTIRIIGATFYDPTRNGLRSTISIRQAGSVTLEGVKVVNGAGNAGISDTRAGPASLVIIDSVITDNPGVGILVAPSSGVTTVALDGVKVTNSNYGLAVGTGGRVMVDRSTFSTNAIAGVEADGGAFIGINNSLISSNNNGVQAGGLISLANTDIKSNNTGISGATQSFGNNRFFANITDGTAPSAVAQH